MSALNPLAKNLLFLENRVKLDLELQKWNMDTVEDYIDESEKRFYEFVRQHLIYFLLFIFLYLISYSIIRYFKKKSDYDELYAGKEDLLVFRTSLWMCTCSLAVSLAAALLLPFSVVGSEIINAYPNNYYFKWLNWPLIHTLWNYIFALSNLSLFILLPFAYFFIESQGIMGHGKSIMARVYETLAVCVMLIVLLACLADVIHAFFVSRTLSISVSILNFTSVNLPFIYSCISLFGLLGLLITTPAGFTQMFTVASDQLLARIEVPNELRNQEDSRQSYEIPRQRQYSSSNLSCMPSSRPGLLACSPDVFRARHVKNGFVNPAFQKSEESFLPEKPLRGYQKVLQSFKYLFAIIILLVLTVVSVLMVIINILQLLFGYRVLPVYVQYINVNSRHVLGIFGVVIEVIIIGYLMLASLVGLYSSSMLKRMRPRKSCTSMSSIVANCTTILILSSALPVLARTLGITTFDLLGEYGNFNWLSNLKLILAYNVLFVVPTVLCLVNHLTAPVRRELVRRVKGLTYRSHFEDTVGKNKEF